MHHISFVYNSFFQGRASSPPRRNNVSSFSSGGFLGEVTSSIPHSSYSLHVRVQFLLSNFHSSGHTEANVRSTVRPLPHTTQYKRLDTKTRDVHQHRHTNAPDCQPTTPKTKYNGHPRQPTDTRQVVSSNTNSFLCSFRAARKHVHPATRVPPPGPGC